MTFVLTEKTPKHFIYYFAHKRTVFAVYSVNSSSKLFFNSSSDLEPKFKVICA